MDLETGTIRGGIFLNIDNFRGKQHQGSQNCPRLLTKLSSKRALCFRRGTRDVTPTARKHKTHDVEQARVEFLSKRK